MNRRRKNRPKEPAKVIPVKSIPPQLKDIPVVPIEVKDLPNIACVPIQKHVLCPHCGHETSVVIKREYTPIPESFEPFYQRARRGDLKALVEYYKEQDWRRTDLGSAFYQCLGYLVAKGFPKGIKIAEAILRINKTSETFNQTPAKIAIYRYWYRTYKRAADEIARWLKAKRKELYAEAMNPTRADLWREYTAKELPSLDLTKLNFYHKNLKELFMFLAQTNPHLAPSQAARKVAAGIAEISQGSVSHKNLRK